MPVSSGTRAARPGAPPTGQPRFLTPDGAEWQVANFVPWTDRPDDRFSGRLEWYDSYLSRLTFQVSPKNKINFTYDEQRACNCGSTRSDRAQEYSAGYRFDPNRLIQTTWTSTQTSRLLLEAAGTIAISQWNQYFMPGVEAKHVRINDQWSWAQLRRGLGEPRRPQQHRPVLGPRVGLLRDRVTQLQRPGFSLSI